jgi:hypothetical protein
MQKSAAEKIFSASRITVPLCGRRPTASGGHSIADKIRGIQLLIHIRSQQEVIDRRRCSDIDSAPPLRRSRDVRLCNSLVMVRLLYGSSEIRPVE